MEMDRNHVPHFGHVSWVCHCSCAGGSACNQENLMSNPSCLPSLQARPYPPKPKTRTRATLSLSWKSSCQADDNDDKGWRHVAYFGDMRAAERRDAFVQHILCVDYSYFLTSHTLINKKQIYSCSQKIQLASASNCRILQTMRSEAKSMIIFTATCLIQFFQIWWAWRFVLSRYLGTVSNFEVNAPAVDQIVLYGTTNRFTTNLAWPTICGRRQI